MRQRSRSIVFDFDYTLADSSRGAIDCINFAFDELGLPAVSAKAAKRTIGLSLPDTFLELANPQHAALVGEFARLFVKRADAASSVHRADGTREMNALGHSSVMSDLTILLAWEGCQCMRKPSSTL